MSGDNNPINNLTAKWIIKLCIKYLKEGDGAVGQFLDKRVYFFDKSMNMNATHYK